jgi:hypothetical protein
MQNTVSNIVFRKTVSQKGTKYNVRDILQHFEERSHST